jgi:hypothetical protein
MKWPMPMNVPKVRNFMGLAGYYRRFRNTIFAKIENTIMKLQKKNKKFVFEKCAEAFRRLKELLTTTPIIKLPNMGEDFYVQQLKVEHRHLVGLLQPHLFRN